MRKNEDKKLPQVTQMLASDMEEILGGKNKYSEETKDLLRAYFLKRQSINEIADSRGISKGRVYNAIVDFHKKIEIRPLMYVHTSLSMPYALACELQELGDEIAKRGSVEEGRKALSLVNDAVIQAKKILSK